MKCEIRPMRREDVAAVASVYVRGWQVGYQGIVPDDYLDALDGGRWEETFRLNFEQPGRPTSLVLWVEGRIAGAATVSQCRDEDVPEGTGEVISLYLLPEYWGQGLGKSLLEAAMQRLREMGFDRCVLWTLRENQRAQGLYERLGFERDGMRKTREIGGAALEVVRFVRML